MGLGLGLGLGLAVVDLGEELHQASVEVLLEESVALTPRGPRQRHGRADLVRGKGLGRGWGLGWGSR